jgi:Ni,Fe-hydrogenase III large subunit
VSAGARTAAAAAPEVTAVAPDDWRAAFGAALAEGRFLSLFAARDAAGAPEVRAALASGERVRILRTPVADGAVPSVVGLAPAAEWDEREARDLHGVRFDGHDPHRALAAHPADPGAWMTPVEGPHVHQVAVGPIHAGVIESGHFRFHVVGERVLHLDLRLFYKHRGLERAAEGQAPERGLALAARACGACAVANAVAYAQAHEAACGLWPDPGLRRVRTLLLELERIYNHLNDIGAICAGIGFAAGNMAFAALKERAQRVNRALTGHRFLFGAVRLGRSDLRVALSAAAAARAELRAVGADAAVLWRQILFDASVRDRVAGAGVLPRAEAERLGCTGPSARASGVARDARSASPRLWYPGFRPALPPDPAGDVAARLEARAVELPAALAIADDLLGAPIGPGAAVPDEGPSAHGVGAVEGPRGETTCVLELREGRVARMRLRAASYANWPAVARAAAGAILPDFPLVNKSFELCYACADR